jgi:hypothetical protein
MLALHMATREPVLPPEWDSYGIHLRKQDYQDDRESY